MARDLPENSIMSNVETAENAVILLVEDCEDDITLTRRAFHRLHRQNPIYTVRDAEEALAYLNGKGKYASLDEFPLPGIILLDLKMPRMDGFEFLQWLRNEPAFSAIPVVVLTSSDQPEDVESAYALGANCYLQKPSDFDSFLVLAELISELWFDISKLPESHRPSTRP
jgi:two-component system response regulator